MGYNLAIDGVYIGVITNLLTFDQLLNISRSIGIDNDLTRGLPFEWCFEKREALDFLVMFCDSIL